MTNYISPNFTSGEEVDELLLLMQGNESFFEDLSDGNIEANVLVRTDVPDNLNSLVFGDNGLAELAVEKNGDGDPIGIRSGTGSGVGGKVIGSRKDAAFATFTTVDTDSHTEISGTRITLPQGNYALEFDNEVIGIGSPGFQEVGFVGFVDTSASAIDADADSEVSQQFFQGNTTGDFGVGIRLGQGTVTSVPSPTLSGQLTLPPSFFDIQTSRSLWVVKWKIKLNKATDLFLVARKDTTGTSDFAVKPLSRTVTPIV